MASPSTVITLGYGSFGSVNLVPTLGYGSSSGGFTPTETYCVNAAQAYTAGASRSDWHTGYAAASGTYTAGGNRTQGEC